MSGLVRRAMRSLHPTNRFSSESKLSTMVPSTSLHAPKTCMTRNRGSLSPYTQKVVPINVHLSPTMFASGKER